MPLLSHLAPLSHARLPPALPLLLRRRRHLGPSPTAAIVGNLTLLLKMDVTTVKSRCFVYLFHLFQLFVSLVANFVHFYFCLPLSIGFAMFQCFFLHVGMVDLRC